MFIINFEIRAYKLYCRNIKDPLVSFYSLQVDKKMNYRFRHYEINILFRIDVIIIRTCLLSVVYKTQNKLNIKTLKKQRYYRIFNLFCAYNCIIYLRLARNFSVYSELNTNNLRFSFK